MDSPQQRAVASDQQRADQLLELVKWATGLRGVQQMVQNYSGPAKAIYEAGSGMPGGVSVKDFVENTGAFAPGGAIQGAGLATPGGVLPAVASGFRGLAPVLGAGGTGMSGSAAQTFPALQFPNFRRMAGAIAKKPQDVDDIEQAANLAATKLIATKGGTGKDVQYVARTAAKNWSGGPGGMGSGIRKGDRELVDKAVTKLGDVGSDKLADELNRVNPQGKWTIEKVQNTRGGRSTARLDNPDDPTASGLRSLDQLQPDRAAELKQQLAGMSPGVRKDAEALINGEISPNEINPARLARVRAAMGDEAPRKGSDWYERAVAQKKRLDEQAANARPIRPISGGSGNVAEYLSEQVVRQLDETNPTWRDQMKKGQSGMGGRIHSMNQKFSGVVNPEHPAFKELQSIDPKLARIAQLDKDIPLKYIDREMRYDWGQTRPGLGPNNPTLLAINPNRPANTQAETPIHELLHGLYANALRNKAGATPNPPEFGAMDIARSSFRDNPGYGQRVINMYLNEDEPIGHAALEGMARRMALNRGKIVRNRVIPED